MPDSLFGVLYQCWPQPDGSLRLEFLSEGAERLLEATADEVLKGLVDGTFPLVGVDREKFYADFAESVTRHSSWKAEFGYVGPKSGVVRWFRAQDFPRRTAEGAAYFSGVLIDITELKRAEERAREAYSELEAHLANTPLAVVEWDREARIRRWSGRAEAMFGWRADEVRGRTVYELDFVHEGDLARLQPVVAELLEQRVPGNVCRNRNRHKSGLVVDCLWHNSAHLDRDGKIVSVLALGQDMTEQAAVEGELTLSEERLRTSLRFAGMLSWDIDIRRMSMYYSQDVREFFGVPDLPEGADLEFGMAHPDDRARVLAEAAAASLTHRDFRLQYRGVRPDPSGQTRWFSTRGSFVATSDGELARCMGVTADITERRREELDRAALDGELREARHLESLGRMAGGIAHDFNNLLTIILGNAGIARMIAGPDGGIARPIGEIESACGRAAHLCSQIGAYAGVGRMLATEVALDALLRGSEAALQVAAGRHAVLKWSLGAESGAVQGEARQIRQAVLNAVANAGEASGERGGEIGIATDRLTVADSPEGFSPPIPPGEYLRIRIADSGDGMPEAVRARAFEAFYSTKFTGRGLGLAAVHGIVRDHGGSVRLRSRPGVGTTLELLLPALRIAPDSEGVAGGGGSAFDPPPDLGTVLVVDDDPNIRELICSVLEDDGYTVSAAATGAEALALFDGDPGGVRAAVVDLLMPGTSGEDVIRRLRMRRAGLPCVVVSGFAERELPADVVKSGPTRLLPKPFRLEELSAAVRGITSAAPPA